MDIILLEKIDNVGSVGDTVSVKSGYARNYLIPKGKATLATPENIAKFEGMRSALEAKAMGELEQAQARAAKIEGQVVKIQANAGPEGKLFGSVGTIAIAEACIESGLSEQLGEALSGISALPLILMIGVVCLAVTFLTEVTSNTATANLLLPILAATAVVTAIDPRLIMIPATISASFAFMLPVATPPNAIVFGNGALTVRDMMRQGLVLNLFGVVVVTLACWLFFG